MSTVRIQVRRGTSSEWTTANPVLAAGEMGVETNTNKFKFGNGSSTWTALSYAAADTAAIGEISQDAIDTALSMGAGLTKTYNDGANTITISVDSAVVATVAYVDTAVSGVSNSLSGYLETGDRGTPNGVASLNAQTKILESELDLDGISLNIETSGSIAGSSISTAELVATDITSGGQIDANNVVISGNLTVTGTSTTVNTTNLSVTDPLIQVASNNSANTVDLGFVAKFNDGTNQHSGLVRDSSESKWKLFKGVTTEPTTNVDFTQGSLDTLAVGAFEASSASIGNVSNIELQYLNGVGSPIQTQIDTLQSNIDTTVATLSDYAPKLAPTISNLTVTGLLTLPNSSIVAANIADGSIGSSKIIDGAIGPDKIINGTIADGKIASDAAIAQSKIANLTNDLAAKANLAAPTFTGTVVLPTTTSIGDVSATEIGYIDGVTSSIQTQLDGKAASSVITDLSSHTSATTNIHGIADTAELATKSYADAIGTTATNALALKAPLASPTFTGTVVLPTVTAGGSIVPTTDNTFDLGSPTNMWKDIYVGPGSLYVNGQKVLQDESGAIVVSADINENLGLRTSGSGNIELDPTGTGSVNIKGPLVVEAGANFSSADGNGIAFSNGIKSDSVESKTLNTDLSLSGNGTGKVYLNDNAEVNGNLVVGGNLTVSGTTTSVNTETISLADNIIDLNSNFTTGTPTENSGLRVMRGDLAAVQVRWNESTDKWEITNDGTNYSSVAGLESPTFTGTVTIPAGASIEGFAPIASPTFTGAVTVAASGVVFTDGTQTKAGVPSRTPIIQKTGSYTLSDLTERDSMIEVASASATTITIPANSAVAYPVGTSIDILQTSTGQVTIAAGAGVTVNSTPGLKLRTQWSGATLFKRATDTWVVYGDLSA